MKRYFGLYGILLAVSFLGVQALHAAPTTWIGTPGANWSVGGNWDTANKPTSVDDAIVGANSVVDENFTILSLTVNNTATISASGGSAPVSNGGCDR